MAVVVAWRAPPSMMSAVLRPLSQDGSDGCIHESRLVLQIETVAQHHGEAREHGERIGPVGTGDIGGGPVHRFVESRNPVSGAGSQRGRRQHAKRSCQHGGAVRQDVAEHVRRHHDVELAGVADKLHGGVVGQHVGEFDVRILLGPQAGHLLAPQQRRFQDIGLVDGAHPAVSLAGEFEGHATDAQDLTGRVDEGVDTAAFAAAGILDAARLPEVDAAGQFAHDHDVEARDDFGLERRGVGEGGIDHRRAQVGEELHLLPEAQEGTLGPHGKVEFVPARTTDGAEENGVNRLRPLQGVVGQRRAVGVDAGAADEGFGDVDVETVFPVEPVDHAPRGVHDLRSDSVTGQEQQ